MNIPIGKIIIVLILIIIAVFMAALYQAEQEIPIEFIAVILFVVGGIIFFIADIILLIAAFGRDVTTGLLFVFIPIYPLIFAFTQYESENKPAVIAAWFGGSLLMIVGAIIYISSIAFWDIFLF